MELFETIAKFFLLSIIGAIISVLTGGLVVLVIQRFNPRLKDVRGLFRLALAYVSGLIVLPTFYAAYYTNGKTVLWMALILWLSALAYLRPKKPDYIPVYKHAPYLFICFVLCYLLPILIIFDFGSEHISRPKSKDNYYYCLNLIEGMKIAHVESFESNPISNTFISPKYMPYHYYDLWCTGFYAFALGVTNINSLEVICPTLFFWGIVIVIGLVVNSHNHRLTYSLLLGYIFLFFNPLDLFDILGFKNYVVENLNKINIFNALNYPVSHDVGLKFFPPFLIISLLVLFYQLKSLASFCVTAIILIVLNISYLAVIPVLIMLILSSLAIPKNARKSKIYLKYNFTKLLLLILAILTTFRVLDIESINRMTNFEVGYFPKTSEVSLIKFSYVLSRNVIVLTLLFALTLIFLLIISRLTLYTSLQKYFKFTLFSYLVLCVALFGARFAQTYFMFEDAGQLFYMPFIFFEFIIFLLLLEYIATNFLIIYFLLLLSFFLRCYVVLAQITSMHYDYDFSFVSNILSEKQGNKIGAAFFKIHIPNWVDPNDVNFKKLTMGSVVDFLSQYSNNYIAAIPLIDLHVPIDTLNPREVAIRKHFIFYNYFQQKKMENPYITEREAQIMFMRERNIDWVFHDSTFTWPQEWEQYVRKKIVDPNTRATMVYLKPWSKN